MDENNNPQMRILNSQPANNTNIDDELNSQIIQVVPNLSAPVENSSQNDFINLNQNTNSKFINKNQEENSTSLNDLNVNGEYNNLNTTSSPYSQEPKVRENIDKKNTITVDNNSKVFIIIIIVLFIFIMFMPTIFDFFRNLIYSH